MMLLSSLALSCAHVAVAAGVRTTSVPSAVPVHHVAIRTRNIENAMRFYSLFGLEESVRFRAGPARAAWLVSSANTRVELIEVPASFEPELRARESTLRSVGLDHLALDVTDSGEDSLADYLVALNKKSEQLFSRSVKLVLPPYQQMIGDEVYELAFVGDPDGVLVELIRYQATLPNPPTQSDW